MGARHRQVKQWALQQPAPALPAVSPQFPVYNAIDRYIGAQLAAAKAAPQPLTSDLEFLRRLSLDTIGLIPTPEEIRAFLADPPKTRRQQAIDRLLAHLGRADRWVSYWQDVLAENPSILKPDLNNTGPFRWWLHQCFCDNLPFDRMVTELVEMEGSAFQGGPAAFAQATLNDAPMAAKAHILSQAFLGQNLTCARCHDAPLPSLQTERPVQPGRDAGRETGLDPASSTVKIIEGFRKPRIQVTSHPGDQIAPAWPFPDLLPEPRPPPPAPEPSAL